MRKACALVFAILLACPICAADGTSEQKRLEACGQVFKEIMDSILAAFRSDQIILDRFGLHRTPIPK
jgi:hypothetical protein